MVSRSGKYQTVRASLVNQLYRDNVEKEHFLGHMGHIDASIIEKYTNKRWHHTIEYDRQVTADQLYNDVLHNVAVNISSTTNSSNFNSHFYPLNTQQTSDLPRVPQVKTSSLYFGQFQPIHLDASLTVAMNNILLPFPQC